GGCRPVRPRAALRDPGCAGCAPGGALGRARRRGDGPGGVRDVGAPELRRRPGRRGGKALRELLVAGRMRAQGRRAREAGRARDGSRRDGAVHQRGIGPQERSGRPMAKSQAAMKQVCGIDLNKLDGAAISNALEHYGIAAGKASIERRTEMLKGKLDELDKVDRARPVETPPDPAPDSEEELAALSSLGGDDPEPGLEIDDTGDADGTDIPDPDYVQQSLGVPEPEPQVLTQVRGKAVKDKKAKKNALAKVETVHEAVLVENVNPTEFDKFVAEVKQIQNVANVSSYMLAKKLAEGEMSGVWKTKLNVKQKPEYGNFDAFAQVEL